MLEALLIAEKPDLMRQIETVYKKHEKDIPYHITFTSQRGHLVTLKSPDEIDEDLKEWKWEDLPIHPENHGGWQYKIIEEKKTGSFLTAKERYQKIKDELSSGHYDFIINAGDPDQEGELLIRIVLRHANNMLPIKRFWTNDLTEGAIVDALKNLKDDEKDPMLTNLLAAAYGRQHSDYRFGMNLSRAATLKMNKTISCGRVETPILAIVCRREEEIRNFKPSTSYGVKAEYKDNFDGRYFDISEVSGDENADDEAKSGIVYFKTKKEAEDLIATLGKTAKVVSFEKKEAKTTAPKLFKLASAQIAAGKLGYNDADTLAIIQKLYEKKFISYPRTDCEYLSSKENFRGILSAVAKVPEFAPYVAGITDADINTVKASKKWVNDKALEDSGHTALRPTEEAPDLSSLSKEEQDIYSMICRRFVAIFLPPLIQEKTTLITDISGKQFKSSGKTLVDPGYTKIFGQTFTDMLIPELKTGDIIDVSRFTIPEKTTTCPKRFTSPDLIDVCEHPLKYLDDPALKSLGKHLTIGTPATRSATIRKLIKYKYLTEKKEKKTVYIIPTELGEGIIKNLGDCDICKVDLTGLWEEQLQDVRAGKMTLAELEEAMKQHVEQLIKDIKDKPMTSLSTKQQYKKIADCPLCGKKILSGEKGAFCAGWKDGCKIWFPREKWGAVFTDDEYLELLKGNEIKKEIDDESGKKTIRIKYDSVRGMVDADEKLEVICKCPSCGGEIYATDTRFYCAGDGVGKTCPVSGYRHICGAHLEAEDIKALLRKEEIEKTCSKDGREWQQKMKYSFTENKIEFVQKERNMSSYHCPCCKKSNLYETEKMYRCNNNKCGFTLWKTVAGHVLTDEEIKSLLKGSTEPIDDFVSKKGSNFSAKLKLNKRKKAVEFEFENKK